MLRRQILWFGLFLLPAQMIAAQSIPAGSLIPVEIERRISTQSAAAGERVAVKITKALKEDGLIVAPGGSELQGRIDFVERGTDGSDGWMRLVFTSMTLPDGRSTSVFASTSLTMRQPRRWLDYAAWMAGGGTAAALLAGNRSRISGLLGGLLVGMVIAQHIHQTGRDLTLHTGQIVRVRLSSDLEKQ